MKQQHLYVFSYIVMSCLAITPLKVAQASSTSGDITDTGASSENINNFSVENETDISVENKNKIKSNYSLQLETGENSVKNTTEIDGDVASGDITLEVSEENRTPESSSSIISIGDGEFSAQSSISSTGYASENENNVSISESHSISEKNATNINTQIDTDFSTGGTQIRDVTRIGSITSGSISVSLDLSTSPGGGVTPEPTPTVNPSPSPSPGPTSAPEPRPTVIPEGRGGAPDVPVTVAITSPAPSGVGGMIEAEIADLGRGGGFFATGARNPLVAFGLPLVLLTSGWFVRKRYASLRDFISRFITLLQGRSPG